MFAKIALRETDSGGHTPQRETGWGRTGRTPSEWPEPSAFKLRAVQGVGVLLFGSLLCWMKQVMYLGVGERGGFQWSR